MMFSDFCQKPFSILKIMSAMHIESSCLQCISKVLVCNGISKVLVCNVYRINSQLVCIIKTFVSIFVESIFICSVKQPRGALFYGYIQTGILFLN